jgi:hypothetical protein
MIILRRRLLTFDCKKQHIYQAGNKGAITMIEDPKATCSEIFKKLAEMRESL